MSDQNLSNFDPFQPQAPEPAPKKKNSQFLITAFSVLGVLIILSLAAFIYYLLFLAPSRGLLTGDQTTRVNIQETALQAAAEATAMEIYLHPSQIPPTQAEPKEAPPAQVQPQTSPEVSELVVESAETTIPPTVADGKTQKEAIDIPLTETVAALLNQSAPGETTGQSSQPGPAGEAAALEEPSEKSEQTDAALTKSSFSAQVGLLALLGLATMLLLAFIIVRRLRLSRKE